MAEHKALVVVEKIVQGYLNLKEFSGTVKVDGPGVKREILVYKYTQQDAPILETFSDPETGAFSFEAIGNKNDKFTVLCLGKDDTEQTTVFNAISGA